jgi:predicted nucleotidyltransferase
MQLQDKHRAELEQIFESIDLPIEILAFGSRVTGGSHEGSDLDLVIRTNDLSPVASAIFTQLIETIRDSNIPFLVQLIDWAKIPESFHVNINKNYEVIFDNRALILKEPKTSYSRKDES